MSGIDKLVAWLGGRQFDEMAGERRDYENSSAIGWLMVLSVVAIACGQYLFWGHLPDTASDAVKIAVVLALVYVTFYRQLIRMSEVVAGRGKWLLFSVGLALMGVNAILAGHELVLLAFGPQVQALGLTTADHKIADHRDMSEKNQGLPQMQRNIDIVSEQLEESKRRLANPPQALLAKQEEAKTCWRRADGIKATIARLKSQSLWEQVHNAKDDLAVRQSRCRLFEAEARRLREEFENPLRADIPKLETEKTTLVQRLTDQSQLHETAMQTDQARLRQSETSGAARHRLLWAAVASGEVPWLEAYGLMAIALLVEGGAFLAKFILPKDRVALDRHGRSKILVCEQLNQTEEKAMREGLTWHLLQEMKTLSGTVAKGMREDLASDMRQHAEETLLPGLRVEAGLAAFENRHRQTVAAQQQAGRAVPASIMADLAKMGGVGRTGSARR
jgi:hypothetical protein